jgi:hypothetical protein
MGHRIKQGHSVANFMKIVVLRGLWDTDFVKIMVRKII